MMGPMLLDVDVKGTLADGLEIQEDRCREDVIRLKFLLVVRCIVKECSDRLLSLINVLLSAIEPDFQHRLRRNYVLMVYNVILFLELNPRNHKLI